MTVNIVDAFIVIFLVLGGIIGYKQGAIKTGTRFLGLFVVIMLSFILKDKLMVALYENLPFFNFFGLVKGADAINILFYQLVSFLFIFAVLTFLLRVLLVVTGLVEQILKMTIFLSIPSRILGIFVGALEYYVYVFLVLYILNIPIFNLAIINESEFGNSILQNTPILSDSIDNTIAVYTDVWNILKDTKDKSNSEVNLLVLATLLDNKLISLESAKKLVESNKIYIENESILDSYEEENFYDKLKEVYDEKYS